MNIYSALIMLLVILNCEFISFHYMGHTSEDVHHCNLGEFDAKLWIYDSPRSTDLDRRSLGITRGCES
jgi:hypothetical protein